MSVAYSAKTWGIIETSALFFLISAMLLTWEICNVRGLDGRLNLAIQAALWIGFVGPAVCGFALLALLTNKVSSEMAIIILVSIGWTPLLAIWAQNRRKIRGGGIISCIITILCFDIPIIVCGLIVLRVVILGGVAKIILIVCTIVIPVTFIVWLCLPKGWHMPHLS